MRRYQTPHALSPAGLCLANPFCWGAATDTGRAAVGVVERGARSFAGDPAGSVRSTVSSAAFAAADWAGQQHDALTRGGGFEGGRTAGHLTVGVFVAGATVAGGVGAAKGLSGAIRELPGAVRGLARVRPPAIGWRGGELTIGKNFRLSPFGNKKR